MYSGKLLALAIATLLVAGCNDTKPQEQTAFSIEETMVTPPNSKPTPTSLDLSYQRAKIYGEKQHQVAKSYLLNHTNVFQVTTGDFDGDGVVNLLTTVLPEEYTSKVFGKPRKPNASEGRAFLGKKKWVDELSFLRVSPHIISPAVIKIKNPEEFCLHARTLIVADYNFDGIDDIAVACHGYDAAPMPGDHSYVLLSEKRGLFRSIRLTKNPGFYHGGTALDVNNDGMIDIVFANHESELFVYMNNGDGTFHEEKLLKKLQHGVYVISSKDLNKDGYPDLLIAGDEREFRTRIYWNDGKGEFSKSTIIPGVKGWESINEFQVLGDQLFVIRSRSGDVGGGVQQINLNNMTTVGFLKHDDRNPLTPLQLLGASDGQTQQFVSMYPQRNKNEFLMKSSGDIELIN